MASPIHRLSKSLSSFRAAISKSLDPSSLQVRLTLEIAILSLLSMGSIALWASWRMQQTLITTHEQNLEAVGNRFVDDVEVYSDMMPINTSIERAIRRASGPCLLVWVRDTQGKVIAQSAVVNHSCLAMLEVSKLTNIPDEPTVQRIGGRHLIMRGGPLIVKGQTIGRTYVAQNITEDQRQLNAGISSLAIVSTVAIIVMVCLITLRIHFSLRPLHQLSLMAGAISAEDLGTAQLQVQQAPSEIKGLVQTFNMMLSRLSSAWEQQRQFVSNVSHELRTPLTVVHGYLQSLLRRGANLSDYQREAVETAAAEADRTVHLLQDLLELARADSGHLHFQRQPVVLNALLHEVAGMAEKVSNRAIQVTETAAEVVISADPDRLRQVLINLIDNAVKYSDADQSVDLILTTAEQQALVQVCDRGIGIPLQHQSRIFERFYRVDEARTRTTGGCGLGLAIVKTLVEGMGGQVSVRSKTGEGSVFTVALPLI